MQNDHQVVMSPVKYPGGLRIFECNQCRYAFAAKIDDAGVIMFDTRVRVNNGDLEATHSLFMTPVIELEMETNASVANF